MRAHRPTARVFAAFQAAVTAFAVLIASHHEADVRHVETAAGTFVHAASEAASTSGERTIVHREHAAADGAACLLCRAALAPVAISRPATALAASTTLVPVPFDDVDPAPPVAIWRTAPKTSPPA